MFVALITATLVVAAADWVAVATQRRRVEYVLKPLTMVLLISAALSMSAADPSNARWWLVAGLVASLAGDVFLVIDGHFVEGLGSFLVGHVLYVIAFITMGVALGPLILGAALAGVALALLGVRVVRGAAEHGRPLAMAVVAYMLVISVMVTFAFGTTRPAAIIGALLFYASDGAIGWSRFVDEFPHSRLFIMITYHLGQIGLVLSLLGVA